MFFSRKTPTQHDWSWIGHWLSYTEDKFQTLVAQRRENLDAAELTGTSRTSPSRGVMSPQEAWDDIMEIAQMRRQLKESGWLPPREKDVIEKSSTGQPTKWNVNRKYEKRELPAQTDLCFVFDQPPA